MSSALPPDLTQLLDSNPSDRDAAWESFLAVRYRLLLHVARSFTKERDTAMEAFAWILERLREADFRRLRAYAPDGRSEFSTWLVVVARRLCLDWYRAKYGRDRSIAIDAKHASEVRRRLVDLVGESVDSADLPETSRAGPEAELQSAELSQALHAALAELDPSDRLLLKLRFDDGLSAQRIADFMHLPTPFHVYRRLETLLGALRRALRARGVEGPVP